MYKFPKFLKEIRKASGVTQDTLAIDLGVSKPFLVSLENSRRKPSKDFVRRLADYLDVRPHSIMPMLDEDIFENKDRITALEKKLLDLLEALQLQLIQERTIKLKRSHEK
jgi:transcriptional regulator with XRE-family HTH domain